MCFLGEEDKMCVVGDFGWEIGKRWCFCWCVLINYKKRKIVRDKNETTRTKNELCLKNIFFYKKSKKAKSLKKRGSSRPKNNLDD